MAREWKLKHFKEISETDGYKYYGLFKHNLTDEYCCALTNISDKSKNKKPYRINCSPKADIFKTTDLTIAEDKFTKYYGKDVELITSIQVRLWDIIIASYQWNNIKINWDDYDTDVVVTKNLKTGMYSILKGKFKPRRDGHAVVRQFNQTLHTPDDVHVISVSEYYDDSILKECKAQILAEFEHEFNIKYANLYQKIKELQKPITFDTEIVPMYWDDPTTPITFDTRIVSMYRDDLTSFSLAELENLVNVMKENEATKLIIKPLNKFEYRYRGIRFYAVNDDTSRYLYKDTKANMINEFCKEFDEEFGKESDKEEI